MGIFFVLMYILAAVLVASLGRHVVLGFWGCLILSLLITPIPVLIFLLIFRPRKEASEG